MSRIAPTQTWRTFLRNQAFGIGTIGLGEAGRLSDNLLALVRGWIARVVRSVTKVRDGYRCELIEPLLTLHRLRPYRSSNRTARRDPRSGCMPVPRLPTTLSRGDNWTMADRRLSPLSLEGITDTPAAGIHEFAPPTAIVRASGPTIPTTRSYRSATNNPAQKANDRHAPSPTRRPLYESALADKVMRTHRVNSSSTGDSRLRGALPFSRR